MVRSVAGNLPEQVKNNQSVNTAAGNGGQKMSQYSWFTVYKRANVVTFTTLQYHLLLVLWKVYLENLGYNEGNFVTKGDLIDKIKSYELILTRTELNAAFRLV